MTPRTPYPFSDKFAWTRARNDVPSFPEDLPWTVFDRLMGGELVTGVRYYATVGEAMAALEDATRRAPLANERCPR